MVAFGLITSHNMLIDYIIIIKLNWYQYRYMIKLITRWYRLKIADETIKLIKLWENYSQYNIKCAFYTAIQLITCIW